MLLPAVAQAIEEVRANFPDHPLTLTEDGHGGAVIVIDGIDLGSDYEPSTSWIGFRITFQYPYADVYPHYARPDLHRKDGRSLGSIVEFDGRQALQISRRSNRRDPALDSAARKLQRILHWLEAS
jgi:hypothetical protein